MGCVQKFPSYNCYQKNKTKPLKREYQIFLLHIDAIREESVDRIPYFSLADETCKGEENKYM